MGIFYTYEEIPPILTVPELGAFLGIGRNRAYELARSGQIAVLHIGNQIRIPRHAVLRYLGVEETTLA